MLLILTLFSIVNVVVPQPTQADQKPAINEPLLQVVCRVLERPSGENGRLFTLRLQPDSHLILELSGWYVCSDTYFFPILTWMKPAGMPCEIFKFLPPHDEKLNALDASFKSSCLCLCTERNRWRYVAIQFDWCATRCSAVVRLPKPQPACWTMLAIACWRPIPQIVFCQTRSQTPIRLLWTVDAYSGRL